VLAGPMSHSMVCAPSRPNSVTRSGGPVARCRREGCKRAWPTANSTCQAVCVQVHKQEG